MDRHDLLPALALLTTLALAVPAPSITLVDQPLDIGLVGSFSNFVSPAASVQQIADDFHLPARTTLETLAWAGYYNQGGSMANPVDFKIRFFADDGGSPGVPVVVSLADYDVAVDAASFTGSGVFTYALALPALTLDPGSYWISIMESDPDNAFAGTTDWLWARHDNAALESAFRLNDAEAWSITGGNRALTITGRAAPSIPEPATALLLGVGIATIAFLGRRHLGEA